MKKFALARKVLGVLLGMFLTISLFPKKVYSLYWIQEGCSTNVNVTACVERNLVGECIKTRTDPIEVVTIKGFECLFSNAISVVLALAGIVLFVMLLIGGLRYLTSGGDPKATEAARGTLTHAIAGLVVLVLAYLILQLIKTITGVDVTFFRITQ